MNWSATYLQIPIICTLLSCAACVVIPSENSNNDGICNISEDERIDCCPEGGSACSEPTLCRSRPDCCWLPTNDVGNAPWCFFGRRNNSIADGGYVLKKLRDTAYGVSADLRRTAPSGRGNDLVALSLDIYYETSTRVHVRIADTEHKRFVAPYPKLPQITNRTEKPLQYRVELSPVNESFWFKIIRNNDDSIDDSSSQVLFDSNVAAPLIFTDQFIQLAANLPPNKTGGLYGLGQHFTPLRLDFSWQSRFTFWNNDGIPAENVNLYASQPFYMALVDDDNSGRAASAHGVYFHNSGALEVALNPHGTVTWRAIGGVIDLYFFLGPSPAEVVHQYTALVGRPAMPPYWALGFHLCRYGYGSLNRTRYINSINRAAGIPVEVQWNDIDALHAYEDFTYDNQTYNGLPQFIDELHRDGLKYVIMTDPGINAGLPKGTYPPYDSGHDLGVFVKNLTDQEIIGESWAGPAVVWPDFSHPNALKYWSKMIRKFHRNIGFDGLWIDMNEPSNFVSGSLYGCSANSTLEQPPYLPPLRHAGQLNANTLCMTAQHHAGLHYNLHNAYGLMENQITFEALIKAQRKEKKTRPFILTRSNFAGSGQWAAAWNGDGRATWTDLRVSVAYILNYNMFGIPFAGVDLCGFHTKTTPDLCARWSQLGAFYPFVRNHNDLGLPDKDPASMGEPVLTAARQALIMRYRLLPYFYTLFYEAHTRGNTVARPLFFEFANDPVARYLDSQFMIGDGLMIVPVLEPNATQVNAYLPPKSEWFDFYTGKLVERNAANESWAVLDAPYDKINLLQRANTIIVEQDYANSTNAARLLPFHLRVTLPPGSTSCNSSVNENANCKSWNLFWDDGESLDFSQVFNLIEFRSCSCQLTSAIHTAQFEPKTPMLLDSVRVSGLANKPEQVMLNGKPVWFTWADDVLTMTSLNLDLLAANFTLEYLNSFI